MKKRTDLPKRVYEKNGAFWHVRAEGDKRKWTRLCAIREGLPAMYRALADLEAQDLLDDSMTKLIGDWLRDVGSAHSKKTQANDAYQTRVIGEGFAEFKASQVRAPHIVEFLKDFRDNLSIHGKADDLYSVWGCAACHRWLDRGPAPKALKYAAFMAAHLRQVLEWRAVAFDPASAPRDRNAALWALERLNSMPNLNQLLGDLKSELQHLPELRYP